jgi:hypothetical protein
VLANGTGVSGKIVPLGSAPLGPQRFNPLERNANFAAKNFDTISTDAHIDNMVIVPCILPGGAHENAAGTVHFEPLLDHDAFIALSDAVRDHPRSTASSGRTGCGIVAVIKNHAGVEAGPGSDRFAANEIKEISSGARQIFGSAVEIEPELLQCLQRTERDNGERQAGGNSLNGRAVIEISRMEAGHADNVRRVVDRAKLGILLRHFSKDGLRILLREAYRHAASLQIEQDFARAGLTTQNESGSEGRMSGKRQFFPHGKDANADPAALFCGGITGKNKSSFGEIHLARQGLHLLGAKAAAVKKNGERVAGERAIGKYIDLHHRQSEGGRLEGGRISGCGHARYFTMGNTLRGPPPKSVRYDTMIAVARGGAQA